MNDDYKEVNDTIWADVEKKDGCINFRRNRKRRFTIIFFRSIVFILIAIISGILSANYFINKKYPEVVESYENKTSNSKNNISVQSKPIKQNAITTVAEVVGPAVVAISNKAEGFFGNVSKGTGSGIIFDEKGYIVTNYHVIEGASTITIKLSSGKQLTAKVIGKDPKSDLAVIKVEARNLPVAKFGDSSKVRVGDLAIAIGNPLGEEFAGSVTSGIISALNRTLRVGESVYKVIQTDAAINPGNSGGALCNERGEVIGINSLKINSKYDAEGMGFAIGSNEAKHIIDELMKHGRISRPIIGIYGGTANPKATNGVEGIFVTKVIPGTGADKVGIRPSDIIIEFDNKKVKEFGQLSEILEKHKVGDRVTCKVWRNGKIHNMKIRLTEIQY
ncbi:S1C family serine protease [Haloimpatiens sp. FM7330]|uniref:S1C family serine protease n=1 Tax=Haloimpatiens sp. FM7330 TaxID=3298610 RepID=UPI00362E755A